MGLNLETLIGILLILILLIFADGLRRIWRERRGRLRMNIRPVKGTGDTDGSDQYDRDNPEVLGSARVVGSRVDDGQAAEQQDDPPLVMETDEPARNEPVGRQPRLFPDESDPPGETDIDDGILPSFSARGTPEVDDAAGTGKPPEPSPETDSLAAPSSAGANSSSPGSAGAGAGEELVEVLVVHMLARRGERLEGRRLLELLLEHGLRFGEMNIFHCHQSENGLDVLQFSMANAVEPGTFDIEQMEEQEFAGVSFFLKLPGPGSPLDALDHMLEVSRRLAVRLDAELRDEQRSVLTPQTAEHMRERVREFERRQRVLHGQ